MKRSPFQSELDDLSKSCYSHKSQAHGYGSRYLLLNLMSLLNSDKLSSYFYNKCNDLNRERRQYSTEIDWTSKKL